MKGNQSKFDSQNRLSRLAQLAKNSTFFVAASFLLISCGGGSSELPPDNRPVITRFSADPGSIFAGVGSVVMLTAQYVKGTGIITEPNGTRYQPVLVAGTTDTYTVSVTPMVKTTYTLSVSNGVDPSVLQTTTVNIRKPGEIAFKLSSSQVSETVGDPTGSLLTAITLTVTRTNGTDGVVSINYQAGGGLAINGTDYNLAPGVINFANGDSTPKTIKVGIINNDSLTEVSKSFTVSLSNPTNGATLATIPSHTVTIIDNDILALTFGVKQLKLNWKPDPSATFYKMWKMDSLGATLLNGKLTDTSYTINVTVHKYDWLNSSYFLEACNDIVCTVSNTVITMNKLGNAIGYFKASNTRAGDNFGQSVAISGDGNTLAVAAPTESSDSKGVDSIPNYPNIQFFQAGAVYIFTRSTVGEWTKQAYVKASNTGEKDKFGSSVALNFDGSTLAVGAKDEGSSSIGINSIQNDNTVFAGAAYVFKRDAVTNKWQEQAYIKAKNSGSFAFGYSIALNASGDTLAVGARLENGSTRGINTTPVQNTANNNTGAAYVFQRSLAGQWAQQAYIKASNANPYDLFGSSLSLSDDGNTLAVGAVSESSNAKGIDQVPTDYTISNSGAAYIYKRTNNIRWFEQTYIKASNAGFSARFGGAVGLSGDGQTLVVGASRENSSTSGIDSTPDLKGSSTGAAYVFYQSKTGWVEQAYIKASNSDDKDYFAENVTVSRDGNRIAIGAAWESGSTKGINSTPDNLANATGAVYVYERLGVNWIEQAYIKSQAVKPSNSQGEFFGSDVAFDDTGKSLAIGAFGEDSNTIDVGSIPNGSAGNSGAVYLY